MAKSTNKNKDKANLQNEGGGARSAGNGEARRQVAALPLRRAAAGGLEVMLVRSRTTGRWIIPKGWPSRRRKDHEQAAAEAREEAGVKGDVGSTPIGRFEYFKRLTETFELVAVDVYVIGVTKELADWPEQDARERRWMAVSEAADLVVEPGLVALLVGLDEGRIASLAPASLLKQA
ncbi:MAG: NUDIX hydrolase [Hyphomicrobiaceae bacterium]|nr:NUDIX hydrolase [Hyphomicrobiaceae bacterium]